LASF